MLRRARSVKFEMDGRGIDAGQRVTGIPLCSHYKRQVGLYGASWADQSLTLDQHVKIVRLGSSWYSTCHGNLACLRNYYYYYLVEELPIMPKAMDCMISAHLTTVHSGHLARSL